jgi:hypothetical protein
MKQSRFVLLLGLVLLLAGGCSLVNPPPPRTATAAKADQPAGRYYDFDDIQVPRSLGLVKEESKVFVVDSFKAGVLVFKNNVNAESLVNYFLEGMAKDNWVLKSSFKYPAVLFFAKRGKACVIEINEATFSTELRILVAPTIVDK